jgi:cation/acetate symporter
VYYMLHTNPVLGGSSAASGSTSRLSRQASRCSAGMLSMFVVSLCTPAPAPATIALVDYIRAPEQ